MSSIIFDESLLIGNVENDRHFAVNKQRVESLPDYVRRVRNEKGLSLLDVERRARQLGHEIAGSYVNRIENEIADAAGVTPKKLQALAAGLDVSEDEIFAVARGKSLTGVEMFDSEIAVLFNGFDELSDEDKLELLSTVKMLANEIQRRRPRNGKPKK
jgi:transcriptional regulator with XRE-family HTH domain